MSAYKNRGELVQDIQKYMNRSEPHIVKKIPQWIHMAEDMLDRVLRHPAAIQTLNYSMREGDQEVPAPDKLLELKTIKVKETGDTLFRRSIETLADGDRSNEYPVAFCSQGEKFILDKPAPKDMDIQLIYFEATEKLKTDSDTNLYLFYCGDILLYYALSEGFGYDNNQAEAQYWEQKAVQSFTALEQQIEKEKVAGSTLVNMGNRRFLNKYF